MAGTGIGNMVQATPAIQAISTLFDETDILLGLNFPESIKLFTGIPGVNKVYDMHTEFFLRRINLPSYDKLIVLKHEPYMPGYRINYYGKQKNFLPISFSELGIKNDVMMNMEAAYQLGYDGPVPKAYVHAEKTFPDNHYDFIFIPGCAVDKNGFYKRKKWHGWVKLADLLKDDMIAIVGTKEDLPPPFEIQKKTNIHDYRALLPIQESINLINSCRNIITIDNGLAHCAAALGKKVFVIFGATNLTKCLPWGDEIFVIKKNKLNCSPCLQGMYVGTPPVCKDHKCMDISSERLYDLIQKYR